MKKTLIFLYIISLTITLMGMFYEVNCEGGCDFTTIQGAVNTSSAGDTILVYPGRYVENVDLLGKPLVLGSLYMTSGSNYYIHNTIIDGNQTGTCILAEDIDEEGAYICGFTICNGSGYYQVNGGYGGGMYINESTVTLKKCIIENNTARGAGGMCVKESYLSLAGCTIRYNEAKIKAGGISCSHLPAPVEFSTKDRCNIYDNFACMGLDIYNYLEDGVPIDVIVDTFTVLNPESYEFFQSEDHYEQDYSGSVIDILHPKYERVYADMYVSPEGSDENSGLTPDDPVQTINHALHVITGTENNPRVLNLAPGIYSRSGNNQKFPISPRSHIFIEGASTATTIIDLEEAHQGFAIDRISYLNYGFKNLTIRNLYTDFFDSFYHKVFFISNTYYSLAPVLLENLYITQNHGEVLFDISAVNLTVRNCFFYDNYYENYFQTLGMHLWSHPIDVTILLENCRFYDNLGGHIYARGDLEPPSELYEFNIVNCDFSNNDYASQEAYYRVGTSVNLRSLREANIVNCTFGEDDCDTVSLPSAPLYLNNIETIEIMNNVIYGNNTDYSLIISGSDNAYIHHNIIENGYSAFYQDWITTLNWEDWSIWADNPLYDDNEQFRHLLCPGSAAIDIGSDQIPAGIDLPRYDLSGNDRIIGERIDLGAYESPLLITQIEEDILFPELQCRVFPNPFNPETNIAFDLAASGNVLIEIYNLKGQKISTLIDKPYEAGRHKINWNASALSSGIYLLRFVTEDKSEMKKLILLK